MDALIERPIFFIGMPRSGTTVVFENFSMHEQLGWLSNYSARLPHWPVANVARLALDNAVWSLRGRKQQYGPHSLMLSVLPKPQEAYPFWQTYCGADFLWEFNLRPDALDDAGRDALRRMLHKTLVYQGRSRFSAKLTGPSRIGYLRSIFPDAMFVHVIRDGRAVVDSLLRVSFWRDKGGLERPFWRNALSEAQIGEWERSGKNPAALASYQWLNVITSTRNEAAGIGRDHYVEVKYEDFVSDPGPVLRRLYEWCGLEISDKLAGELKSIARLKNMNSKYLERPEAEIKEMDRIMGVQLAGLGY